MIGSMQTVNGDGCRQIMIDSDAIFAYRVNRLFSRDILAGQGSGKIHLIATRQFFLQKENS